MRLATAALIPCPSYMDTAYYAAGAVHLAQGGGFSEPFIWNYLNDPSGMPHPGFLYWMPLPSLLGAPSAVLFSGSFFALQIPFVMLSALIPLLAYGLAWQATGSRRLAWTSGLLAVFSGFFFPYWTLPETFTPFALSGGLALWLAGMRTSKHKSVAIDATRWLLVGLLVGVAHLTRADGVLLLPIVALATLVSRQMASIGAQEDSPPDASSAAPGRHIAPRRSAAQLLMITIGYGVAMGPWLGRNLMVAGTPLPPGGTKTIWLTKYDDLFCYACDLSPASYLAWGWDNILRSKLSALWINAQRFLAEDCLIFLLPFVVIGLCRLRRQLPFLLATVYLGTIYLAHSLIFTFPGWRGGFFHASSAVLPYLYAAAMNGMDVSLRWAARRRRGWRYREARTVFTAAVVVAAVVLSSYVSWQRMAGWRTADAAYKRVDRWLSNQGEVNSGVMVGNPPGFWYHARRPTTVVPNGDVETLLQVADRYQMCYVLLEKDHPRQLGDLHAGVIRHPRLQVVKTWSNGDNILFAVQP